MMYAVIFSYVPHFWPITLFYLIIWWWCKSWNSSLCTFLHPLISSSLSLNSFLIHLPAFRFLWFPLKTDQVSHPYQMTDKM
jgi:hypothetical protein